MVAAVRNGGRRLVEGEVGRVDGRTGRKVRTDKRKPGVTLTNEHGAVEADEEKRTGRGVRVKARL